jgi:hypothetical protein
MLILFIHLQHIRLNVVGVTGRPLVVGRWREFFAIVICSLEFNKSLDRYLCGGHRTMEILHIR